MMTVVKFESEALALLKADEDLTRGFPKNYLGLFWTCSGLDCSGYPAE